MPIWVCSAVRVVLSSGPERLDLIQRRGIGRAVQGGRRRGLEGGDRLGDAEGLDLAPFGPPGVLIGRRGGPPVAGGRARDVGHAGATEPSFARQARMPCADLEADLQPAWQGRGRGDGGHRLGHRDVEQRLHRGSSAERTVYAASDAAAEGEAPAGAWTSIL